MERLEPANILRNQQVEMSLIRVRRRELPVK
jgi:hypothetical protein